MHVNTVLHSQQFIFCGKLKFLPCITHCFYHIANYYILLNFISNVFFIFSRHVLFTFKIETEHQQQTHESLYNYLNFKKMQRIQSELRRIA